jgi:hypothetical protein
LDEARDPEFLLDAFPLLRLPLLLGDIVLDTQPVQGLPFLIAHKSRLIAHPHHPAISSDDSVLHPEVFTSPVSASLFGQNPLPVFGMHPLSQTASSIICDSGGYPSMVSYCGLMYVTAFGLLDSTGSCT